MGKAKATESVVLHDGSRLVKKSTVKYWCERQGAREDFWILFRERFYKLSSLEFKRRFKIIIKSGEVRLQPSLA
ncbi:MAG: hypothetical protein V1816_18745 [Pseudomonadota bacterium]